MHSRTVKTVVGLALAASAITPAAASARPDLGLQRTAPSHTRIVRIPETQIVRASSHDGLDWGDAGIGAAAGLGLAALIGGGVVATKRRTHRPRHSAAVAR